MPNQELSGRVSTAGADRQRNDHREEQLKSTADEAKDVAQEAKQQVVEEAKAAKQRAVQRGKDFADERKHQAASEVEVFGSAVREAANKLEEEGQESVACYAEACADELDRAAGYLRDRDFTQLYRDASQFARKRPEVFLGGMFIAGLAISRFLKASDSKADAEPTESDWDHESADIGEPSVSAGPAGPVTPVTPVEAPSTSTPATAGEREDAFDEPPTSSAFESGAPTRPGRPR